jgi:carbonic anhydrase
MNKVKSITLVLFLSLFLIGCQSNTQDYGKSDANLLKETLTKESRDAMTPDDILKSFMDGNQRFMNNELTPRDFAAQAKGTAGGQHPEAVILSCIDSRVPVEYIFDKGIGDIFVARVAGNVEDEDILGSLEYATAVAGSKVVMVLGHESCGAVKSAIVEFDAGSPNVDHLLGQIEPAVNKIEGERNADNKDYVKSVIKENVHLTIEDIRNRSSIIKSLEEEGKIKLVGAYYNLSTGKVDIVK